jgi:hypothetical protein
MPDDDFLKGLDEGGAVEPLENDIANTAEAEETATGRVPARRARAMSPRKAGGKKKAARKAGGRKKAAARKGGAKRGGKARKMAARGGARGRKGVSRGRRKGAAKKRRR